MKSFYECISALGGIALNYRNLEEADFTSSSGSIYTPPDEYGDYKKLPATRAIQLLGSCPGVVETFQYSSGSLRLPANTAVMDTNDAGDGRFLIIKNSGSGQIDISDYLDVPLYSLYAGNILFVLGNQDNQWDFFDSKGMQFEKSGFDATNVQDAIVESRPKSGYITYTSFVGNPKKAPVTFSPAFPVGVDYSIVISGVDVRNWSTESKTQSGFIINSNANQPITGSVYWVAAQKWG